MSRYLIQTRDFDNAKQKVFDNVKQYAEGRLKSNSTELFKKEQKQLAIWFAIKFQMKLQSF